MLGIKVEITRFVDDGYPGVVECSLVDAHGHNHLFVDKVPVVSLKDLDANSSYPTEGIIACELIKDNGSSGDAADLVVTVSTEHPWHIDSLDGQTEFDLKRSQLRDFGSDSYQK